MLRKRKTLREIAQEAGVSVTAASLFLNGKAEQYRLSKELCAKLTAICAREHYVPNVNARAMNSKRTDLIGCVLREEIQASFWAEIFTGLDDTLTRQGLHLLPSISKRDFQNEIELFEFMRSKGVDGYVCVPRINTQGEYNLEVLQEYAREKPLVTMTYHCPGLPGVCVDDAMGARLALNLFLEQGHRRLAIMGSSSIFSRSQVFLEEALAAGAVCFQAETAQEIIQIYREQQVTGVFCITDYRAQYLYKACGEQHIRIPEDLSIVGYDNIELSEYFFPPLTTIHQPKYEMGTETAKLLLNVLRHPELKTHLFLEPSLVRRNSTAMVKA